MSAEEDAPADDQLIVVTDVSGHSSRISSSFSSSSSRDGTNDEGQWGGGLGMAARTDGRRASWNDEVRGAGHHTRRRSIRDFADGPD